MARKFKLNTLECADIINKRANGASVTDLQKDYDVSPATVYRVLSGEYTSRMGVLMSRRNPPRVEVRKTKQDLHPTLAEMLRSPDIDLNVPLDSLDPMTKAAANLLVAQARFNYALTHPKTH